MGLRQDGVENVSAVMDRDYNESNRARSRDHSRKNSDAKNHRSSREGGHNGSRPVPIEKPLTVRTDNYENGHYSNSKGGFNHLLGEELTKSALNAVHGVSSSTTPISCGPSTSSSVPNASFASPPRMAGRQEEVQKRRHTVEKIERLRELNRLESFIPQMEVSTPTQMSANVRRYAKKAHLPANIRNFILEGTEPPDISTKSEEPSRKKVKVEEGDETDYEDLDGETASCSKECGLNAQWLMERGEFIAVDTKIGEAIDNTQRQIQLLAKKLEEVCSADEKSVKGLSERRGEEGCARLIAYDGTKRRKLIKMDKYLLDAIPSTSKDTTMNSPSSFNQNALEYLHRSSIMASFHIRKNKTKSIWRNTRELEEEKMRNGVRKKEERDRREKRKMERAVKVEEEDKSDEYEATDDDEDEQMPTPNHSRKTNGAPKEKKRRRDAERKTSRVNKSGYRRSSDCPPLSSRLSSVASRPSLDGDISIDFLTPSFNHSTWLDNFKSSMPTNFTYNKIPVPECKRIEIDTTPIENEEEAEEWTAENMTRRIAQLHHALEHEERLRFQINPRNSRASRRQAQELKEEIKEEREEREESQESGRSESTPSNNAPSEEREAVPPVSNSGPSRSRSTSIRPPPPPFDYNAIKPICDYERLSIEPPYGKRKFVPR